MADRESIRLKRREGRNVFVFQRDGSDLFELEEMPAFDDPRKWGEELVDSIAEPPPLPRHERDKQTWSRTSITGLARKLKGR